MKIELSFQNHKESFFLPINPTKVEVKEGHKNEKVRVLKLGEVNLIGKRDLKSFSLGSMFPAKNNPLNKDGKSPKYYKDKILKWKHSGKPIRVIIPSLDINLAMAIEDFSYSKKEGREDIYYTISLAEYRFLNVSKVKSKNSKPKKNGLKKRPSNKPRRKTYTVKRGDCLWAISKRFYGKGSQWKKLYAKNKKVVGKNPNLIYPGQKLVI